jgi:hypothetical protein
MFASVLIVIVSAALLGYWFRYTCILLLRSDGQQPAVGLEGALDPLRCEVERNYRTLTYVWEHAAGLGEQSIEERILMLDFKIMRIWFRITETAAPRHARRALAEMAAVVAFLTQKLGQQAGLEPGTNAEA